MCEITEACTKPRVFWIQSTVLDASSMSCSAHLVRATRALTAIGVKAVQGGEAPRGYTLSRRYAGIPQNYAYVTVKPV